MSQEHNNSSETNGQPLIVVDLAGKLVEIEVPRFNPFLYSDWQPYLKAFLSDKRRPDFLRFCMESRLGIPRDDNDLLAFSVGETEYCLSTRVLDLSFFTFVPRTEDLFAPAIFYKKEELNTDRDQVEDIWRTFLSCSVKMKKSLVIRIVNYDDSARAFYEERVLIIPNQGVDWGCDELNQFPEIIIASNRAPTEPDFLINIGLRRSNTEEGYQPLLKAIAYGDSEKKFTMVSCANHGYPDWITEDYRQGVEDLAEAYLLNLAPCLLGKAVVLDQEK